MKEVSLRRRSFVSRVSSEHFWAVLGEIACSTGSTVVGNKESGRVYMQAPRRNQPTRGGRSTARRQTLGHSQVHIRETGVI